MARPKVYESMTTIAVRVDDDLLARFDNVCEQVGVSRSALLRVIIEHAVNGIEQGEFELSVSEAVLAPVQNPSRKKH